jgi:hypothetical protein
MDAEEKTTGAPHRHTGTPAHRHTGTPAHRHTGTPAHRHTGTPSLADRIEKLTQEGGEVMRESRDLIADSQALRRQQRERAGDFEEYLPERRQDADPPELPEPR